MEGARIATGARRRRPEKGRGRLRSASRAVRAETFPSILSGLRCPEHRCESRGPSLSHGLFQIHPGADGTGQDLLEPGQLQHGGEDLPQVGGVLQRARHVEAERSTRALHAGQQVQRGHRVL